MHKTRSYTRIFIACATILSGSSYLILPSTSNALSIKEALEATYAYNPTIKAEREAVKSTAELGNQARSGWLPSITYTYERSREGRDLGGSVDDDMNPSHSKRLDVVQPVFNGFSTIYGMKQAKNRFESAKSSYKRVEQNVMFNAVTAYMDLVRDNEVLKLNKNNEKVLQKHLQVTRERFKLGEVTRTDVAQAQARLAVASTNKSEASGNVEVAKATFNRIVGQIALLSNFEDVVAPANLPSSLEETIELSLNNNPTLLSAKYSQDAAEDTIAIRRSSLMPVVTIEGNLREDKGTTIATNSTFENQSIGVSMTIPIYQSGTEYSVLRQAKHQATQSKKQYQETYDSVREFAVRVWHDYQVAKATLVSTAEGVAAAKIALDGVSQEALVGSRTTLDVLDAEQELFSAQVEQVRAKRNYIVAAYNILSATGSLTAPKLELDVKLFNPNNYYESVKYKFIGLN